MKFTFTCGDGHRWRDEFVKDVIPTCPECGEPYNLGLAGSGKSYKAGMKEIMKSTRPAKKRARGPEHIKGGI